MKKNAVGHMMMPKESAASFLRRSHIRPKLLCLLVAIVIWLCIVNLLPADVRGDQEQPSDQLQDVLRAPLDF